MSVLLVTLRSAGASSSQTVPPLTVKIRLEQKPSIFGSDHKRSLISWDGKHCDEAVGRTSAVWETEAEAAEAEDADAEAMEAVFSGQKLAVGRILILDILSS